MFCSRKGFCFIVSVCTVIYIYLVNTTIEHRYNVYTPQSTPVPESASCTESSYTAIASDHIKEENTPVQNVQAPDKYREKLLVFNNSILPYNEHKSPVYIEETLFIGDSNTEGLYAYGYLPLQNVLGKRSMGIQQVLTDRYVWFKGFEKPVTAVEAAKLLYPRRIIINFGTNNVAGTSSAEFISCYKSVISELTANCPYSDIIVAAVLPVGYYRENYNIKQSSVDSFNIALAKMCSEFKIKFLDYSEIFRNPDNGYMYADCVADDGIHLTQKGYKMLLEYVDSHQFVTGDNRPQNCDIPQRCEQRTYQCIADVSDSADSIQADESSSEKYSSEKSTSDISSDAGNINSEKIIYDPFI